MKTASVAAYLRVSTTAQDWKMQRDAVQRAAQARGDRISKQLWFEEKKSGGTIDRPVLQKLRAAVRAGVVGRLYVFRIDRLTRSGIRDTLGLVEEFRRGGCELVTVADGFDLAGPGAEIVLAVMAWAAQIERNAIGERIKAARRRVEAKGGRWGRPRAIDPGTLQLARDLRKKDFSLREISSMVKISRSTLSDALAGRGHYSKGQQRKASSPKGVASQRVTRSPIRRDEVQRTRAQRRSSPRTRSVSESAASKRSSHKHSESKRRSPAVKPRMKKKAAPRARPHPARRARAA